MKQYQEFMEQGDQFLENHDALLNSLLLSKQNAGNNPYTNENSQGVTDGTEQSS
jgi:hypothetical protein